MVPAWPLRLLLALVLSLAASFAAAAEIVSEKVAVAGAVKNPLVLGVEELKAFPSEQISTVSVTRRVDGKEIASTARGVRLTAVLDRAGLAAADATDWKHTVVVATATDGYRVVFSWPELFNGEGGASVLIVFERDGAPLGEREGRIAMIAARDLKTGPRSVRWLSRLDVRVLKD